MRTWQVFLNLAGLQDRSHPETGRCDWHPVDFGRFDLNLLSVTCLYTRPESFAEIRWGLSSAGLVVAELEIVFPFRAQPKKNAT